MGILFGSIFVLLYLLLVGIVLKLCSLIADNIIAEEIEEIAMCKFLVLGLVTLILLLAFGVLSIYLFNWGYDFILIHWG